MQSNVSILQFIDVIKRSLIKSYTHTVPSLIFYLYMSTFITLFCQLFITFLHETNQLLLTTIRFFYSQVVCMSDLMAQL
jgi:hypothetical protein